MKKLFTTPKGLSVVIQSIIFGFQALLLACNIWVYKDSLVEAPVKAIQ